ncbi:hypothetical protein CsatA_024285 [Cannabis sativa]
MMMMKRLMVVFVMVMITMLNNMGWCHGTRVAHSVIIPSNECVKEGDYCDGPPWARPHCCEGLICNLSEICVRDESLATMDGQDGKMVTIMDRDTLLEVLLKEKLSQDQCSGRACAPWSPCQSGCQCIGAGGIGFCIAK